jgi:P27 family predicted phage terminase small subunit
MGGRGSGGRNAKPTALKKLLGNPGKRKIDENEPQPMPGEPEMPELSREAQREWKRIVPILMALGILTIADGPALALYCSAWAIHQRAERELSRQRFLSSEKTKKLLAISEKFAKLAKSMLVEFGLTPASRPRLASFCILPTAEEKDDPAENYFSDIRFS